MQDFEHGLQDWVIEHSPAPSEADWLLTNKCAATLPNHSATHAIGYVREATCDVTGSSGKTSGLEAPIMTLPATGGPLTLTLNYFLQSRDPSKSRDLAAILYWDLEQGGGFGFLASNAGEGLPMRDGGGAWSTISIDITRFAGHKVWFLVGIMSASNDTTFFIDDFTICVGPPRHAIYAEDFEKDWGIWMPSSSGGFGFHWEEGVCASLLPGHSATHSFQTAHTSSGCAVDAPDVQEMMLESDPVLLPSGGGRVILGLNYLFHESAAGDNTAKVLLAGPDYVIHVLADSRTTSPRMLDLGENWSGIELDMTPYAGLPVRLMAQLRAQHATLAVDDFKIWREPARLPAAYDLIYKADFESGQQDWTFEHDAVGQLVRTNLCSANRPGHSLPQAIGAVGQTGCTTSEIGTGMASAKSPEIQLPSGGPLSLYFSYDYQGPLAAASGNSITVDIIDASGKEAQIAANKSGVPICMTAQGDQWDTVMFDLTPYAGKKIRIRAKMVAKGASFFVDDFIILKPKTGVAAAMPQPPAAQIKPESRPPGMDPSEVIRELISKDVKP